MEGRMWNLESGMKINHQSGKAQSSIWNENQSSIWKSSIINLDSYRHPGIILETQGLKARINSAQRQRLGIIENPPTTRGLKAQVKPPSKYIILKSKKPQSQSF